MELSALGLAADGPAEVTGYLYSADGGDQKRPGGAALRDEASRPDEAPGVPAPAVAEPALAASVGRL